ncbi:MAG: prepilin-type N-terminal cleavage/methylation domain-containing protein [Candidatus Omnitrophica bacterium]|nr:prepilin-type N-terminal cleavage/methylation domain-containing protein [Candidatus Omnitrophota bacterium]
MRASRNERQGFTLIELLIVVAIIGILAAIAVPNFLNAQVRAKIARTEADMRSISTALESYRIDSGIYPQWADANGAAKNPVNRRLIGLTTPVAYMSSVPKDHFLWGAAGQRINDTQHEAYVTYDYVDARSTVKYVGATTLDVSFRCAEWRLASAGPDATMTYGAVHSFDATNGLNSSGDIVRTGPRSSYPCDGSLVGK